MSAHPTPTERALTVLICALGGEGGGVLAEWLVETATACGHPVQSTSIPGVAQRTGATTYYVEIFPRREAELEGRRPVFSLNPVPGAIDLLVSSELLEAVRQVGNGMASADRTHVLASESRALTVAEKMAPGDGRVPSDRLLEIVRTHARAATVLDMAAIARRHGTAISAVLFGAIAGTDLLPLSRAECEATIRRAGLGVEASLRGFAEAHDRAAEASGARSKDVAAVDADVADRGAATPAETAGPTNGALDRLPPSVRAIAGLGHARLVDYQDAAYAALYLKRLDRVLAAERTGGPGASEATATAETARWLALWMAFDDIVRVAALKVRAERLARVHREVAAGETDIVRVRDHFKPGVPEVAGLLPTRLAQALLRWDRRRVARGLEPFALPLKIGTHTVLGALALRTLATCKGLRRRGSRWAAEQALIERWLEAVERGAREDTTLGFEVAACGRLIKGYGATRERGEQTLLHIVEQLAPPAQGRSASERTAAIRAAREAALADAAGTKLDEALRRHGAAPRPVREQPLRYVRPAARPGSNRRAARSPDNARATGNGTARP
jgi:indolepyruvate ferredoxin oxidoreductase beta subunit